MPTAIKQTEARPMTFAFLFPNFKISPFAAKQISDLAYCRLLMNFFEGIRLDIGDKIKFVPSRISTLIN